MDKEHILTNILKMKTDGLPLGSFLTARFLLLFDEAATLLYNSPAHQPEGIGRQEDSYRKEPYYIPLCGQE